MSKPENQSTIDGRIIALIFFLAALVYSGTLSVPFQWDGIEFIADNPIIHDMDNFLHPSKAEGFRWYSAFKSRYVGYLSMALNYALHGASPSGYHVFNIAVHVLTSVMVYLFVVLIFRSPLLKESGLASEAGSVGMWAAFLFAAHPAQSEAVTYIFQRHASLVGLFYLGSIVSYLRFRTGGRARWYVLALLSALLAMKTKENAFTLPLMMVMVEWIFFVSRDNGQTDNNQAGKKNPGFLWLVPLLLTMAIVPLSLVGLDRPVGDVMDGLGRRAGHFASLEGGGREYLLTQVRVVATYLRLFLLPVNQNLDYDYPTTEEAGVVALAGAALLHLMVWAAALLMLIRGRRVRGEMALCGFGVLWFYLALAVESSIIRIPMLITEYRMYVPLVGLVVGVSVLMHMGLRGQARKLVLIALVALLSVLAVERNALWQGRIALWEDTASKSPLKARPWYNLGVFTEAEGKVEQALGYYEKAISLYPGYVDANYNMGVTLARLERYEESALSYKRVLSLDPGYADAVNNLGVVYEHLGRMEEAVGAYRKSVQLKPDAFEPRLNLGSVLVRIKQYEQASSIIEEALSLDKGAVSAYEDLGMAYFMLGRYDDASEAYRKAVSLAPLSARGVYNLGTVSLKRGQYAQAANQFKNAIALKDDYAEAHMGLAAALEGLDMFDEALKEFEAAVEIAPDNARAFFRLGAFQDTRGMKARAVENYLKAIGLDPKNANAMNNLGTIYNEQGDRTQARRYFTMAVEASPSHADAHNNLGVAYYNLRQYREAYEEFSQAVALVPGNPDFRTNLKHSKRVLGIRK